MYRVRNTIQPHQLQTKLTAAGVTHDQVARVDIRNIEVAPVTPDIITAVATFFGKKTKRADVRFCNIANVQVGPVIKGGDGAALPWKVLVKGLLRVTEPGFYNLVGALLNSNGKITLEVDEETRIEPACGQL